MDKEFNVRGGKNAPAIWQPCEILFEGNKYIVVRNKDGREFSRRKSKIQIRDIDNRTDKEKAIDEVMSSAVIFANRETMENLLSIAYDKWKHK